MSHSKSGATSFLSEKMGPQNLMFKNHVLIEIAKIGGTPRKQTQVAMDQYAGWWFQAIINIFLKWDPPASIQPDCMLVDHWLVITLW